MASFPRANVDIVRAQRLNDEAQRKQQAEAIANNDFVRVLGQEGFPVQVREKGKITKSAVLCSFDDGVTLCWDARRSVPSMASMMTLRRTLSPSEPNHIRVAEINEIETSSQRSMAPKRTIFLVTPDSTIEQDQVTPHITALE